MNPNMDVASLRTIASGALEERFADELQKVIANIYDDATDPEAKRTITIKIEVLPDETRQMAVVKVVTSSKLAPRPASGFMYLQNGVATVVDVKQQDLFPDSNVVKMGANA